MSITAKQLAKILGVSPATISLVFNEKPGISDSTIKLVLDGAAQYGYVHRPKKDISNPRETITYVIYNKDSTVVGDTAFFSSVLQGAELEARNLGYQLVVNYIYESRDLRNQLDILHASGTNGIILLSTELDESKIGLFTSLCVPIVILDNHLATSSSDAVYINNIQGAYTAVSYLIKKGHTEIGYLASTSRINNFVERESGVDKALVHLLGKGLNPAYHFSVGPSSDAAYHDMKEHLRSNPAMPTAFFADNDLIAAGCMKAMKESGFRIPDDISIIGFDNMPLCELIDPPLTTIGVSKNLLGQMAVQRLHNNISSQSEVLYSIALSTTLVERDSVRKL